MNEQSQKNEGASCCSSKLCGLVRCLVIGAVVATLTYFLVARSEPPRRLWLPVLVQANGSQTILGDTRQLEFWTPSLKTKDYLHADTNGVVASEQWEALSNNDAVVQFGALLHSNANVLGYRRVEDWGQGQTNFKPGWWWTVNVFSNYSVVDFGNVYQAYWKSSSPVFVEVIDSRGSKEE
ncbi:MAG TPA: hypothetical protein VGI03_10755 [Verrucomicrobiae bacterium]|jgi:hypothetical protein